MRRTQTDHLTRLRKDPESILDYAIDFSPWLAEGDTIDTIVAVNVPAGLTLGDGTNGAPAPTKTSGAVQFWLLEGNVGGIFTVSAIVTTTPAPAKTVERSIAVEIGNR